MPDLHNSSPFIPPNASRRLRGLIGHSVERILTKNKDDDFVAAESIRHIIDWLVVADQQDASWIHRVNAQCVPLKLAKCGSLDRLCAEADKAMRRETQRAIARLDPAQAGEGEEIEMTLDDGWTIVRLLTPEALDRESARMGHCVGNGAYDDLVALNKTKIFSLRCPSGKSHITMEIGEDIQIQGRQNTTPSKKHHALVHQLFVRYNQETAYWCDRALHIEKERMPEVESLIMKDPHTTIAYAAEILKGRWPEAENLIKQKPASIVNYACFVIGDRWPECEEDLKTHPREALNYAMSVIKGPWPEAEPFILNDLHTAIHYAIGVKKGVWPECEDVMLSCPETAFRYARLVLRKRWPRAEPIIQTSAKLASLYAMQILRRRWPEAESVISKDSRAATNYAFHLIKGPWPEADDVIFSDPISFEQIAYAKMLLNQASQHEVSRDRHEFLMSIANTEYQNTYEEPLNLARR